MIEPREFADTSDNPTNNGWREQDYDEINTQLIDNEDIDDENLDTEY